MTTQTEALKLALEALTHLRPTALTSFYTIGDRDKAITAIKEALAQQEQEPVAHTTGHCENHKQKGGCQLHNLQCGWPDCELKPITAPQPEQETVGYWKEHAQGMQRDYDSLLADYKKLAQQEQEPVAMRMPKVGDKVVCIEDDSLGVVAYLTAGGSPEIMFDDGSHGTYLLREFAELFRYTTPQSTWQGLTDEDKKQMAKEANYHWEMTAGEYAERIGQLTEAKLKEKNT